MPFFDAPGEALAAGETVTLVRLWDFNFADGHVRTWDGSGEITVGGDVHYGFGEMLTISPVPFGENDSATSLSFTLSGVGGDFIYQVTAAPNNRGRPIISYLQFLDGAFSPVGPKRAIAVYFMDTISIDMDGPSKRTISLAAETFWTARNRAQWQYFSDRDQQARFPGDLGCQYIPSLAYKTVDWPLFAE